tara:strand:+ start:945 stop:1094 length:150 start_codon:yes stop_codon:yes gene_type:complete
LFRINWKDFNPDDHFIEYIVAHYRPDQYCYQMSLIGMPDNVRAWSWAVC